MKKNILIIDDSTLTLKALKMCLLEINDEFQIITAQNGKIGLERCKNIIPDLIFLDLIMPYMNGIQFLKVKKLNPELADVPTVIISTISESTTIKQALSLGAIHYLLKPVSINSVKDIVFKIFNITADQRSSSKKGEVYILHNILVAEISNTLQKKHTMPLKYELIVSANLLKTSLKRFLIIFYNLPNEDISEANLVYLFRFYLQIPDAKQENIKVICSNPLVAELLKNSKYTQGIEIVDNFDQGIKILILQLIRQKGKKIPIEYLNPGSKLFARVYDDDGNLIKNKNDSFTEKDIEELKVQKKRFLYYMMEKDIEEKDISEIESIDLSSIEMPKTRPAAKIGYD